MQTLRCSTPASEFELVLIANVDVSTFYLYLHLSVSIYKRIGNSTISSTAANRIVARLYSWTR